MRAVKPKNRRRATILLMVVSLLALLFVIVTGFLSLARNESRLSEDISRSDLIDSIVEDMDDWAIALIKEQIVDDTGSVLPGGDGQTFSREDIPGYRHSNYLAAIEPVWDPGAPFHAGLHTGSWSVLNALRWPAVTSLDDGIRLPQVFRLFELMRDYHPADTSPDPFRVADVQWNARDPFMDADGDGVPDSHFLFGAAATEAANTMAGTSVQLPRVGDGSFFRVHRLPRLGDSNGTWNDEIWQRYDQHARYEVAMRIISHGGMVTLSSPTLYDQYGNTAYVPFNRRFTIDLFDSIRSGSRSMREQYSDFNEQNRLFDQLQAGIAAVEPSLRRRFTLPSSADEVNRFEAYRRVPPILAELQGETNLHLGFRPAFIPSFTWPSPLSDPGNYQRINIGVESTNGDERQGWAHVVARNPTLYNTDQETMQAYNPRHFITTINYSDELARKQELNDPRPTDPTRLELGVAGRGATFEGALKFYLGEVSKAFNDNTTGSWEYDFDYAGKGKLIIEQLARVYYDMLASHSGSDDDWGDLRNLNTGDNEVVSRRQQAFMLAVNTVAFAAPRDTGSDPLKRGLIDLVTYWDPDPGGTTGIMYTGYSPQPFFTEVIAYDPPNPDEGEPERGGEEEEEEVKLALAVEMYNPQDPYYTGSVPDVDLFALNLSQFGIRVDEETPTPTVHRLDVIAKEQFLNGREFLAIAIKDTSDGADHFDDVVDGLPLEIMLDTTTGPDLNVSLLRRSNNDIDDFRWAVIDRIRVPRPDNGEWKSRARDTSPVKYYNCGNWDVADDPDPGLDTEFARWNMVMGKTAATSGSGAGRAPARFARFAMATEDGAPAFPPYVVDPDNPLGPDVTFSPTIPLITMNAGPDPGVGGLMHARLNRLPMFGNPYDLRPNSFPTVGFMMFIPRYSHAKVLGGADPDRYHVMSRTLKRQWEDRSYTWVPTAPINFARPLDPTEYPADFGHMPIFDNTQPVTNDSYLAEVSRDAGGTRVGMPWGLLVFDYFTTLNRTRDVNLDGEPDVDPLRVPGRININTAPWYVLANLPMLGPYDAARTPNQNGELWIRVELPGTVSPASPSPAFWDPMAGVLAGYGGDPYDSTITPRLLAIDDEYWPHPFPGNTVPWPVADRSHKYLLGPWLAQSAAAYRDGVQYLEAAGTTFWVYADSQLRGGVGNYTGAAGTVIPNTWSGYYEYRPRLDPIALTPLYGRIRGALTTVNPNPVVDRPDHFGFVSIGELLNVKGFDSSNHVDLSTAATNLQGVPLPPLFDTPLARGDFVKAVSLLALLDTQYLTTRSNTFTVYTSVMDREEPEASVRSQVTVDRSNLLPRMTYAFDLYDPVGGTHTYYPLQGTYLNDPGVSSLPVVPMLLDLTDAAGNPGTDTVPETPVRTTNEGAMPQVIAKEQVGYFSARHDD